MKAVLSDRDGTLLDFYGMYLAFMHDLYAAQAVEPPGNAYLLSYDCWQRIQSGDLQIGPVRVRDRIDEVAKRYMHLGAFYQGAAATIRVLRSRGVRVGIVSGWVATEPTRELCRREGVAAEVDCILTRDDLDPSDHPVGSTDLKGRLLGMALERLQVAATECMVVGDSPDDIAAGKALGACTVAVRTGNGRHFAETIAALGPDHIIDSVAELTTLLPATHAGHFQ